MKLFEVLEIIFLGQGRHPYPVCAPPPAPPSVPVTGVSSPGMLTHHPEPERREIEYIDPCGIVVYKAANSNRGEFNYPFSTTLTNAQSASLAR